jgi:hypothetical protein
VSKASSYLPAGFHPLTVHLTVSGAALYIGFLKQAFDAVELTRSQSQDGRILNASVRVANSQQSHENTGQAPHYSGQTCCQNCSSLYVGRMVHKTRHVSLFVIEPW